MHTISDRCLLSALPPIALADSVSEQGEIVGKPQLCESLEDCDFRCGCQTIVGSLRDLTVISNQVSGLQNLGWCRK